MKDVEAQKSRSRDRGDQQSTHEHRACGEAELMNDSGRERYMAEFRSLSRGGSIDRYEAEKL